MMKNLFYLLCLVALLSCKTSTEELIPDPEIVNSISKFEVIKDPNDPFKFQFKNLSEKHQRVEWRFGDDTLSTAMEPVHTYKATGNYDVELRTFSSTGAVSKNVAMLTIHPDSVMKLTYAKTGVPNEVRLGVETKAEIASVLWTFTDVSPTATSPLLNPLKKFIPGTLNILTAKITTKGGSVATVSKPNFTSQGFVKDYTKEIESFSSSAENNYTPTETSKGLFDNNFNSKFLLGGRAERAFTYPLTITANYSTPQEIKVYAIGNANDAPARDPKEWTLQGSNDGVNWEILDSRIMEKNFYTQRADLGFASDTDRYQKLFFFGINNPKPFSKYKLVITANWGDALIQFSEWNLYN